MERRRIDPKLLEKKPVVKKNTRIKDSKALNTMPDDSDLVFGKKTTDYVEPHTETTSKPKPLGYIFGRPTKYDPTYCDEVVTLGAQGYTKEEMCAELKFTMSTMHEWCKLHSDFSNAVKESVHLAQAYMERKAREALDKPTSAFNHSLWTKIVQCRFPHVYRDVERKEISGIEGQPIPVAVASTQVTGENLADFYKGLMDSSSNQ
jgi:hypothetical protein